MGDGGAEGGASRWISACHGSNKAPCLSALPTLRRSLFHCRDLTTAQHTPHHTTCTHTGRGQSEGGKGPHGERCATPPANGRPAAAGNPTPPFPRMSAHSQSRDPPQRRRNHTRAKLRSGNGTKHCPQRRCAEWGRQRETVWGIKVLFDSGSALSMFLSLPCIERRTCLDFRAFCCCVLRRRRRRRSPFSRKTTFLRTVSGLCQRKSSAKESDFVVSVADTWRVCVAASQFPLLTLWSSMLR